MAIQVFKVVKANNEGENMMIHTFDTGFYVGCMYQEYTYVLAQSSEVLSSSIAVGNSLAFMAGR